MINKILAVVVLMMCKSVYSAIPSDAFNGCADTRYAIFHINGIFTIERQAKKNRDILKYFVDEKAPSHDIDPSCIYVDYSWNKTGRDIYPNLPDKAYDLYEAYVNWKEQGGVSLDFYLSLTLDNVVFLNSDLSHLNYVADAFRLSTEEDIENSVDDFVAVYESAIIDHDASVILVPHSQGNFFANAAYRKIQDPLKGRIHIAGVATPAKKQEPSSKTDLYTTNLGDFIRVVPGALPAKTSGSFCTGLDITVLAKLYAQCHSFSETYMIDFPLNEAIIDNIYSIIQPTIDFEYIQVTNFSSMIERPIVNTILFGDGGQAREDVYAIASIRGARQLYYSNGISELPSLVASEGGYVPHNIFNMIFYGSYVYFMADDADGESKVWSMLYGSNQSSVVPLSALPPVDYSAIDMDLVDDQILVTAIINDGNSRWKPFVLKNIETAFPKVLSEIEAEGDVDYWGPRHYTKVDHSIYFSAAVDSPATKTSIWRHNLLSLLGAKAKEIPTDQYIQNSKLSPSGLVNDNGILYFTNPENADDGDVDHVLYAFDGVDLSRIGFIARGSFSVSMIAVSGKLVIQMDRTFYVVDSSSGEVAELAAGTFSVRKYGSNLIVQSSVGAVVNMVVIDPATLEVRASVSRVSGDSFTIFEEQLYYYTGGRFNRLNENFQVEEIAWPLPSEPRRLWSKDGGMYAIANSGQGDDIFLIRRR